jgi:hypothetical protein
MSAECYSRGGLGRKLPNSDIDRRITTYLFEKNSKNALNAVKFSI